MYNVDASEHNFNINNKEKIENEIHMHIVVNVWLLVW